MQFPIPALQTQPPADGLRATRSALPKQDSNVFAAMVREESAAKVADDGDGEAKASPTAEKAPNPRGEESPPSAGEEAEHSSAAEEEVVVALPPELASQSPEKKAATLLEALEQAAAQEQGELGEAGASGEEEDGEAAAVTPSPRRTGTVAVGRLQAAPQTPLEAQAEQQETASVKSAVFEELPESERPAEKSGQAKASAAPTQRPQIGPQNVANAPAVDSAAAVAGGPPLVQQPAVASSEEAPADSAAEAPPTKPVVRQEAEQRTSLPEGATFAAAPPEDESDAPQAFAFRMARSANAPAEDAGSRIVRSRPQTVNGEPQPQPQPQTKASTGAERTPETQSRSESRTTLFPDFAAAARSASQDVEEDGAREPAPPAIARVKRGDLNESSPDIGDSEPSDAGEQAGREWLQSREAARASQEPRQSQTILKVRAPGVAPSNPSTRPQEQVRPASDPSSSNAAPGTPMANPVPQGEKTAGSEQARQPESSAAQRAMDIEQAQMERRTDSSRLQVVVRDDRLGRLTLRLVERAGLVDAMLRADDPKVAKALGERLPGLLETLSQRGFDVSAGSGQNAGNRSATDEERRQRQRQQQEQEPRMGRQRRGDNPAFRISTQ